MSDQPQQLLLGGLAAPESWQNPDCVYTPQSIAEFLCSLLPWENVTSVLEPSAGGGAWIDAVDGRCDYVLGVDIDPHCRAAQMVGTTKKGTFRTFICGDIEQVQVFPVHRSIGNTPYSGDSIERHVTRCLDLSRECAFLFPLGLLEGSSGAWLATTPLRKVFVLRERPFPKHVRGCAFYWWDSEYSGPTTLEMVSIREPR